MPAEWFPHCATWTSWPADDAMWLGLLGDVRDECAELVRTLARFEPVHLLVRDLESYQDASQRFCGLPVVYHATALDDIWIRDNGPIFVRRKDELSLVNWKFNAWGEKFSWERDNTVPEYVAQTLNVDHWDVNVIFEGGSLEVNGQGLGLTTRQCLLSEKRNLNWTESDFERVLRDHLGIQKLLWLDRGLEGDHTDGHIDTLTRFVNPHTVVTAICSDPKDPNFEVTQGNLEQLRGFTDLNGQPLNVVELPLPQNPITFEGERLPLTYSNFYIGNGFVVVPIYADPADDRALEILRPLFPDRQVIGLSSRALIHGGGSFHCMTQQQPLGRVWNTHLEALTHA